MNVCYQNQYSSIREALLFLKRFHIDMNFQKAMNRFKQRPNFESNMQEILQVADEIFTKLSNEVFIDKEKLDFYFSPLIENGFQTMSDYMTWPLFNASIQDIEQQKEYILQKFHETNGAGFISYIVGKENNPIDKEANENSDFNQSKAIALIDETEYNDTKKWQITKVYLSFDQYLDELFSLIEPILPKINALYQNYPKVGELFQAYWENSIQNQTFEQDFYSNVKVKLDSNNQTDIIILPSLMGCDMVSLREEDFIFTEDAYICMGLLFFENNLLFHEELNDAELCAKLKLMCDSSKFEILKFIKEKPAYGQEIAKELKLTTATISHHMSGFANQRLIRIQTENNRVYYQLDTDTVRLIIKALQEKLL